VIDPPSLGGSGYFSWEEVPEEERSGMVPVAVTRDYEGLFATHWLK